MDDDVNRTLLHDYARGWARLWRWILFGPPLTTPHEDKIRRLRQCLSQRPRDSWQRP